MREAVKRVVFSVLPQARGFNTRQRAVRAALRSVATGAGYDEAASLNGQERRRDIMRKLLRDLRPDCIIETGTYLGNTTGFFAQFGAKVYSSEQSTPIHYAARRRLAAFGNVELRHADSRLFLRQLAREIAADASVFCYLDAHWGDDLPLLAEMQIIDAHWKEYVILIDDFRIPQDAGYGYDDYDHGRALEFGYIGAQVERAGLATFFPDVPSSAETGLKRGYVFLAKGAEKVRIVAAVPQLRQYYGG